MKILFENLINTLRAFLEMRSIKIAYTQNVDQQVLPVEDELID